MSEDKKMTVYEEFNIEVPQDAFPQESISASAARALVDSAMWTDANPMLNLSSFVTTYMEPEVRDLMTEHLHVNYVDHDMYPKTYAMEQLMVKWLHDLWNGPKDKEPYGSATVGSSEACMLAGLAHKWNWREKRKAEGKDISRPNMVTGGNVQVVWKKFMRYFDVEDHIIPLEPGNYRLTAEHLDEYVDENTICVVAIAGQTFTGEDDDIQAIHDWLDEYEKKTGISIPLHIDGASGGFVNPFLYPDYEWDFRLPRVASINASGHKFGLVYPGIGWVIFREKEIFNEGLIFYVNYLGGESATATLNFSRNAGQIIAQCYKFLHHGREGYTRIMQQTVENAAYLRDRLVDSDYFEIMNQTQRIPVVALTLNDDITRFNEFDVSFKVREKGWVLSAYTMPPNAESINSLRIVVRPHLNRTVVEQLANDIIAACDYLAEFGGTAKPPELHAHSSHKC
ncbi:glutamate decarboxylase [Halioglobus sp. HI00S01]|uniref:glutamate decarboxylase n=1 Tax=Halioglobus sp. HI00S01 TaxID=1822214 RepID=UPI0007C3B1A5|nr:glutamate decarboxylase [Halioglobus sp. HI00S01]KZX51275.1 glutamate decarboxylase [Halioglobus sp. HI00S01]